MKAIIFAAGLGTRLKPFTLTRPKALVEVNGTPMLERVIVRLRDAGVMQIVVNVHHFASQIVDFLQANSGFGCDIAISDESDLLLDTGGGIAKAAALLAGDEPFIAYNADILSDFDIKEMIDTHLRSDADITLLTSGRESSRRIFFDSDSRLCGWQNINSGECRPDGFLPDDTMLAASFNGVHIINPGVLPLLKACADKTPVFSIMPFYLEHCHRLNIRAYSPGAPYQWYDIGRNETLAAARCSFRE